jgi:hypothetical protein
MKYIVNFKVHIETIQKNKYCLMQEGIIAVFKDNRHFLKDNLTHLI